MTRKALKKCITIMTKTTQKNSPRTEGYIGLKDGLWIETDGVVYFADWEGLRFLRVGSYRCLLFWVGLVGEVDSCLSFLPFLLVLFYLAFFILFFSILCSLIIFIYKSIYKSHQCILLLPSFHRYTCRDYRMRVYFTLSKKQLGGLHFGGGWLVNLLKRTCYKYLGICKDVGCIGGNLYWYLSFGIWLD